MTPATNRTRILYPLERYSEIVFGLIMVLSFTGALSVAEVGREDIRIMLLGAIGCNLAWGIIDAAPSALGFLASLGVSSHLLPTNNLCGHSIKRLRSHALTHIRITQRPSNSCETHAAPNLPSAERAVVERRLSAFDGVHPQIAADMFGVLAAAGLATYGLDIMRDADEPESSAERAELLVAALSALQNADMIYPHPALKAHVADILQAMGRAADANRVRSEASREEATRTKKETDPILLTMTPLSPASARSVSKPRSNRTSGWNAAA